MSTAGIDYTSLSLPLLFHPLPDNNQKICYNLTLLEDNIFEDPESLSVSMDVSHQRVSIHINRATVVIRDNEEVILSFTTREMSILEDVGQLEACVQLTGRTEKMITYEVYTQPQSAQGTTDNYVTEGHADTSVRLLMCDIFV